MSKDAARTLREAILNSGQSANAIAKATGVQQSGISRFLRGKDLRFSQASKIAAYLGLELKRKP